MPFRMTLQTEAVLRVLLDEPERMRYGLEISKAADLPSGSLYPILARLERAGWVTSTWEEISQSEAGRPRRRYYSLTPNGAIWAENAITATVRRLTPSRGLVPRPSPTPQTWTPAPTPGCGAA